jgi:hypothetical protein
MKSHFSHRHFLKTILSLFILIVLALPAQVQADMDDSSLFMQAFTAFQEKDYLLSIQKLKNLEELYPDSPLRDVSLLMLARAQHHSGDNASAAHTVIVFNKDYGSSSLSGSVEQDLQTLAKRKEAGEKLLPNKHLHAAALKVRNEKLAVERAIAMKAEQERMARERAERDRIAREKAEAERREQERLAAIKAARDGIRFAFDTADKIAPIEANAAALVPFQLFNQGKETEEFSVEPLLPAGVEGIVVLANENNQPIQKITLKPNKKSDLAISFKMPADRVDGSRMQVSVKASSTKFPDIGKTHKISVTATAPLLRAVSRLQQKSPAMGDKLDYKVTLLNVGSKPAKEIDLRINLPKNLKLVDAGANGCWVENEQLAACRIESLKNGQLTERSLKVVVKEGTDDKPLKGSVEVLQTVLQVKESFPGAAVSVKKP